MKKRENKEKTKIKMADLSPNISIITLNANGLHIWKNSHKLQKEVSEL